ncbi:AAA family ATPase [Mycobacterium rhizamassiliense]|uniref:AAA family ATPase n=1 Tax=Mycobacterium rhizamassiliense TaxID=1841860 RepID=UPI001FE82929|nr:ATP-binding protein [Mycobacterium rhizamassiliense]
MIAGRNGSGKSNVIDGLAVLSALAEGGDLRDSLDGGHDGPVVRGGSEGCAPLGTNAFQLGCTVSHAGSQYSLDLEIQVSPRLAIISEHLWSSRGSAGRVDYLRSDPPDPHSSDLQVRWHNGKRGVNPAIAMRSTQLLTSQAATRVPATSAAGRRVHEVAEIVLSAISGIFILDPDPHQMREYVPERDAALRRNADNLSASLKRLASERAVQETLLEMTRSLSEAQVSELTWATSSLGDVMVVVKEMMGGQVRPVPARLMSDGTLRFLAITAALLDKQPVSLSKTIQRGRLLVVEEIESGLHPSQASVLLERIKSVAAERNIRTVATTHSPPLLDALTGADHESVVVASRDKTTGWSRVDRLTDFPDYFEVVGRTSLGDSAVHDRLRPGKVNADAARAALAEIFKS